MAVCTAHGPCAIEVTATNLYRPSETEIVLTLKYVLGLLVSSFQKSQVATGQIWNVSVAIWRLFNKMKDHKYGHKLFVI